MRKLRLCYRAKGSMVTLLRASPLPIGCDNSSSNDTTSGGYAGTSFSDGGAADGGGDAAKAGGASPTGGRAATGGTGGADSYPYDVSPEPPLCRWPNDSFVVALPDEGVPAALDALCSAAETPVETGVQLGW